MVLPAYGSWEWEPMTRRSRVASERGGNAGRPAGARLAAPVEWGQLRAGGRADRRPIWTASLCRVRCRLVRAGRCDCRRRTCWRSRWTSEAYRPGETATLRIVPRHEGKALITVVLQPLDRHEDVMELPEGESQVDAAGHGGLGRGRLCLRHADPADGGAGRGARARPGRLASPMQRGRSGAGAALRRTFERPREPQSRASRLDVAL